MTYDLRYRMESMYDKYIMRGYNLLISKDMNEVDVLKIEEVLESLDYHPKFICWSWETNKLAFDIYNIHDKFINMI